MGRGRLWLVALVCGLLWSVAAQANDASFGGNGASLVPLKETKVFMASEEIVLEQRVDSRVSGLAWFVEARYEFENPTKEVVTLQMGFPETHCHPDSDCMGEGGRFRNMKTRVRGEEVKQRVGKVGPEHSWAPPMGQVYLFDVVFQPGEKVKVHHSYTYDRSESVEGEWVDYLTRTGGLWSRPIGKARFVVRLSQRPWGLSWPPEYKLVSYTEKPVGARGGQTEVIFEARRWRPTRDFSLHMPNSFNSKPGQCPEPWLVARDWKDKPNDAEIIQAYFGDMDLETLRLCRNWPYAHHGYSFKDARLNQAFYPGQRLGYGSPYSPQEEAGEETRDPVQRWAFLGAMKNPHFSPSLLTEREEIYIRLLKRAEEEASRKP